MATAEYLEKLKGLLGIPLDDQSKDARLVFTIDSVVQAVLIWCNITEVPQALDLVVLQITEDKYRTKYSTEFPEAQQSVQSVKRGDVTTTFLAAKSTVNAGNGAAFLDDYTAQLMAYRKLRW